MDGKDPSRRNLRSARAASRGSIVTSLSRETLPISGAREAELSLIAATLANRQLQIANSTSAYYAGVNKKLVETNETLENVLEEEKQSNFTVVEALDKRLEEANKEYTKLKGEVIAAQKSAQREVEKATVEMRDAWEERDHHISSLQKRIEWLEEELESVDAFREARDQHRRDMAVLQKSLENEEKNHAHDCQILRLLLMEERVRLRAEEVQLKKRHDEDVCKLARELCRQQTLEIEEENEGLKSEKIFLYHDAKEAHERISVLQQQNDELRRNAALAALAEKEHLSRAASQNREIKLLREQVKTTEENLNTVVENYEKRLQIQSKEHAAALQQLTRELDEAKNAAERFRRDLVKLRTLSQKMVERRTELEMFFYDALAQVRQEMLEERRRNTRSIGYKQNNLSSSQWGPAGLKKHESEVLLINDRDGRLTLSPFTRPGDEKMSLALQNRETPRSFGNTNPNALSLIPLTKEGEVTVTQKNRRIPAKEWNYSDSGSLTTRFPRLAEEPLCGHSDFSRIPTAPKLKDIQSIEISQLSWKDKERVLQILFKHLQGKCNTSKSKQRPSTDDSKFLMNVAGRRKGHAPPTRSAGDPTWLLGDDDPPAAPAAPAHDALAFLDFDDSPPAPRAAAQPPAPAPLPPSASAPAQVTGPSSAFLLNRREELRKDLSGIQEEIAQYEERIKSLEGGQDELCQEVKRLEREACNKREEEERAALIEAEMEESLNLRRQWINERKGEFQKEELTNASNILRMQHTSDIERLKTLIEDQKKSLLVVKERHDKMDGSICATDIYERVLAQLENTLEKSVREMSNSMCVRIKPFLVGSIRETVVQSSQQRLDILSGDRQRRHEEWDHFQEKMKKQFSNFREERRAKHHVEFDSVFAHAVANFRAAADNRLTISTEKFAERQRVITTETYRCTQRAIDEMVQRFNEELNALEKKQTEDVKRTMTQCTSELAHNGRLCAAEKDAVIGRQCRRKQEEENEKNEQGDKLVSTVYKSLEQKLGFLRTKVEQLRQNLAFNIQEISTATSCGGGSAPFSAQEKALILEDCGRKTRQISNQLGVQWKRFQAILAPLEQCVSSMNDELRESRSKVISMQQGAESAYQAWSHDVRRELSRCLTSSGVSEYSEEIQSGVKCMTQVMENVLFQLQSLRVAHTDGHAEQIHFWKSVEKDIAMLSTHHGNFNDTFHAVFDAYDRLSQVEAELEAKRRSLEIAESDYSAAAQQFEREKNEFNARLKVAEELAAELRQQTAILEERTVFGVHMSAESPENLSDMIVENRLGESMARSRAKNLQQRPQSRERQYPAYQHNTLAESVYDHPAVGEEEEKEVKENETPQHRKGDFSANLPGTLAVDEPKLRAFSHTASAEREGRRQSSVGSNYTPSSDRMDSGSGTKSLTTPSTSNS